jgi:hypothetical protein
MVARYFAGYYERFSFWGCGCKVIPDSTVKAGAYACADWEDGMSAQEYLQPMESEQ